MAAVNILSENPTCAWGSVPKNGSDLRPVGELRPGSGVPTKGRKTMAEAGCTSATIILSAAVTADMAVHALVEAGYSMSHIYLG